MQNGVGSRLKGKNTRNKNRGERRGKKKEEKRDKGMRRKRKEKKMMDFLNPGLSGPSHLNGDFLKF